jgi:hypothetical protein
MSLTWDTAQDRIWYARWADSHTGLRLYVIVEGMPNSCEWDWSVWLPDEPKLTKRGIARSALEASTAAKAAVEECLRESRWSLGRLR